ncbi:MAG: MFS transporter [Acidobacteria bacterium]|nr:MAG: MFS transporter [Acidobacteriota bacterium]
MTTITSDQSTAGTGHHPKGLYVLFGAEMFERICYYGMRGLLTLYLTKAILMGDKEAFGVYGAYTALVYAAPVIGGKLADTVLGYKRAVVFGGIMMAIGEFMILGGNEFWLFAGMGTIIVGNGYFKANISTIVGKLYKDGDPLRDAGFTIFYIGINLGALLATLVVSPLGEKYGWNIGFGLSGFGMLLGIAIFLLGQPKLQGIGDVPDRAQYKRLGLPVYAISILIIPGLYFLLKNNEFVTYILNIAFLAVMFVLLKEAFTGQDRVKRDRIFALIIMMIFNVVFWACFEQAGSSLTLFADRNIDRNVFNLFEMPASQTQFFNPAFILLFGSLFSWMWVYLDKKGINPNTPAKFGWGIIQLGLGYLMVKIFFPFISDDFKLPLLTLLFLYMLHTTGELFLSPIGLSMVTKLAPKHMTATTMGAWFLSLAYSNYLAAFIAKFSNVGGEGEGAAQTVVSAGESLNVYMGLYTKMGYITIAVGVFLLLLSRPLNKLFHGVK